MPMFKSKGLYSLLLMAFMALTIGVAGAQEDHGDHDPGHDHEDHEDHDHDDGHDHDHGDWDPDGPYQGGATVSGPQPLEAADGENKDTVRWGPIRIPGATEQYGQGETYEFAGLWFLPNGLGASNRGAELRTSHFDVDKPCEDCYITGIQPNLVYADGTPANYDNGVTLHHVVNVNWSRPDITCYPSLLNREPIRMLGLVNGGNQRFFASGNERTVARMPEGYGYQVRDGDRWGLIYHIVNTTPATQEVFLEYTFTWQHADDADLDRVAPLWMDADQCGNSEIQAPEGYSNLHDYWTVDRSHTYLIGGGHIHDYGISIALRNDTNGETVCTSMAGYEDGSNMVPVGPGLGVDAVHPAFPNVVTDHWVGLDNYQGHIANMTLCEDVNHSARKGDEYSLHTQLFKPSGGHGGHDGHEGHEGHDHTNWLYRLGSERGDDMGIMVSMLDVNFCLTSFWCY